MPSLEQLAQALKAQWRGNGAHCIEALAEPEQASDTQLAVCLELRHRSALEASQAGIVLIEAQWDSEALQERNVLLVPHARRAFAQLLDILYPEPERCRKIDRCASIALTAELAEQLEIAPFAVIEEQVRIQAGTRIGAHAVIAQGASIGRDCQIGPHVYIGSNCRLGDRVIVQPGAVIGADGYGFYQDEGRHHKIPQRGIVVIEDEVEIGANVTIDRGTFGETRIGFGSKLDNLVHIAHNVKLGAHALLVAQAGISGSCQLGDYVTLAGQVGIAGHLRIGDHVTVAAKAGVTQHIASGQKVSGYPAQRHQQELKERAVLRKIARKEIIKKNTKQV